MIDTLIYWSPSIFFNRDAMHYFIRKNHPNHVVNVIFLECFECFVPFMLE